VQFDEKWAFVGKKQKHCDPDDFADWVQGDCWDHLAFDPEHRLVLSVVTGKRASEHARLLVEDFHQRTRGRLMNLMTSDEHPAYAEAILEVYGEEVRPEPAGRPGRPRQPYKRPPAGLRYATVHKVRERGRVVRVEWRVVFGTVLAVLAAVAVSLVSKVVNTAFLERHHGSDRHRNGRKVRKTYRFSKDWEVHQAVTWFTLFSANFCWPVRTLRERADESGGWCQRTPAMAAGLADHVWSIREWLTYPAVQR
jgi:IS1 family transposase